MDNVGMRVALLQFAASLVPDENVTTLGRLAGSVADVDLIVAPEAAMHDFGSPDTPLGPVAQSLDGPFTAALTELAKARRATVVAGMFERSGDPERPYNTVVAVDADGVVGAYRKIHLYDSFGYRESDRLRAGDVAPTVVRLGDVHLGLMTCYDLRFPEHSRALVDAGAEVLVVPAAWVRGPLKEDHWETLLKARAIENTVYVAAAAQCGRQYCGRSMVVDPMGVVTAAAGEAEGAVVTDVDRDRLAAARDRNPSLAHRRFAPAGHPNSAGGRS
jgi:predicted amidohydrolase